MPIYEHACENCNLIKEVLTKIDEQLEVVCDMCEGPMPRVISTSMFILKGAGFYQNDYKGDKP